jgi:hypothetical protein
VADPRRLVGVDAARGVALLGMMSVHVLPSTTGDGGVSLAYLVASGRAAALFAVLAGVGLALATGGTHPPTGRRLAAAGTGVVARAAVVAAVGLTLGLLDTPVAVILVHYGLLFCCVVPFLGLRGRTLAVAAVAWLVLSPVLAHVLRGLVPPGPGPNPSWESFAHPVELVTAVLLTGYYPVLQWVGYVLVGLAVGRADLRRGDVVARLVAGGAVLAVGSRLLSAALLGPGGGYERLVGTVPPGSPITVVGLEHALQTSMYGTTPTTSWWWLAVSGPHSGTPLDLVHTTGTALLVLGLCLLAARAWRAALLPLAAAGSMTLSLYTAHVVALGPLAGATDGWPPDRVLLAHALVALVVATAWRGTQRRGPLEALAALVSREAGERVSAARAG